MEEPTVGFAGLGLMGGGMARRLLDRGRRLVVWNRSEEKARDLEAAGATAAPTPAALGNASEAVVTMLTGDDAVREVILGDDGIATTLLEGSFLVDMSTTSIGCKREIAEALGERGIGFVDAPVFGSTGPASEGRLVVVAGAADGDLERARPLIEDMAGAIFHMGGVGMGSAMKIAGNLLGAGASALLAESLSLGRESGLSGERMLEVIGAISLNSPMVQSRGGAAVAGRFEPGWPVKHVLKDVSLALDAAEEHGLTMRTLAGARSAYEAAVQQGLGNEDCIAVIKTVRG